MNLFVISTAEYYVSSCLRQQGLNGMITFCHLLKIYSMKQDTFNFILQPYFLYLSPKFNFLQIIFQNRRIRQIVFQVRLVHKNSGWNIGLNFINWLFYTIELNDERLWIKAELNKWFYIQLLFRISFEYHTATNDVDLQQTD